MRQPLSPKPSKSWRNLPPNQIRGGEEAAAAAAMAGRGPRLPAGQLSAPHRNLHRRGTSPGRAETTAPGAACVRREREGGRERERGRERGREREGGREGPERDGGVARRASPPPHWKLSPQRPAALPAPHPRSRGRPARKGSPRAAGAGAAPACPAPRWTPAAARPTSSTGWRRARSRRPPSG